MTGPSPTDDRDLDRWVSEVTDEWQMPPLHPTEVIWRARIDAPPTASSGALRWPVTVGRIAAGIAAVVVMALVGAFLVASVPRAEGPSRPSPTDAAITAPSGVVTDDHFSLAITSARAHWPSGEPIEISTTVRYLGTEEATVLSHGSAFVVFTIEQLDGAFDQGGGRDDSCDGETFAPGEIRDVPFQKSGGYSNDDPAAEMWRQWFDDPELRLPAGQYRITAETRYSARGCGEMRPLRASIEITVDPPIGAAPTPSQATSPPEPVPTPSAVQSPPEPVPTPSAVQSPTEPVSSTPSPPSTDDRSVSDTGRDAHFEVTITSPHARWPANEPIEVSGSLRFIGQAPASISSNTDVPLFFRLEHLDGPFDPIQAYIQPCITSRWRPGDAHEESWVPSPASFEDEALSAVWQQHVDAGTLPPGRYRLHATADYDVGTCQPVTLGTRAAAAIEFVVEGAATTPSPSATGLTPVP
jgi:hypothetical protein